MNTEDIHSPIGMDMPQHGVDKGSMRLAALLSEYSNRPFLFVEPSGNYGDNLIFAGMIQLAAHLGLTYRNITHAELKDTTWTEDTVIYIHGGGGFVPFWSGTPAMILAEIVSRHRGVLVVGPSSYSDAAYLQEAVASQLAASSLERVVFFSREVPSYRIIEPLVGQWAEVLLDHDTAFNLSTQDLANMGSNEITMSEDYPLYALRRDYEAAPIGRCGLLRLPVDPIQYCGNQTHWLTMHMHASRIVTNRLHSAITGAILGKPTVLLPNNYHKSAGVYNMSLKAVGVEWMDEFDTGPFPSRIGAVVDYLLTKNATMRWSTARLYFGADAWVSG